MNLKEMTSFLCILAGIDRDTHENDVCVCVFPARGVGYGCTQTLGVHSSGGVVV